MSTTRDQHRGAGSEKLAGRPAGETGPLTAWTLSVAAAVLVLAMPAWRHGTDGHGALTRDLGAMVSEASGAPSLLATNRALLAGIDRLEERLEASSPVLEALLPSMQAALVRWGGVGNETVVVGPRRTGDGWLVLRSGLDHLVGPPFLDPRVLERRRRGQVSWRPPIEPDPRPALLDFHRQLQARGIELVFMPVPTKAAIHPEALGAEAGVALGTPSLSNPSLGTPSLSNPSHGELLEGLRAAGVHVFDPAPLLRRLAAGPEAAYLRTDSHWSPLAVDRVAAALASRLEATVSLSPGRGWWTRTRLPRQGRGDLWRLLELPARWPLYAEEGLEVLEVTTEHGLLWSSVRGAEVLLLGDSFATVYSDPGLHWGQAAGLGPQLAYHLGHELDLIARPDGSPDQVRRELAGQPRRLAATKVVVYQVATRELSGGDWPLVELPPADR